AMSTARERMTERAAHAIAADLLVAFAGVLLEDVHRLFGRCTGERELHEAARALRLTTLRGDLRRTRERANAIRRRLRACPFAREQVVRNGEGIEIAGLRRELFEMLRELRVRALRTNELDGDGDRVGIAPDVGEALERTTQRRGPHLAVTRVEPPLLQLRGND